MKKLLSILAVGLGLIFTNTPGSFAQGNTIVDVASRTGTFQRLLQAATAAGLADELAQVTNLTVFAPTDAAFARLPPGTLNQLLLPANRQRLRAIIAYHIVPGLLPASNIPTSYRLIETLNGCERVRVRRNNGVTVDNARVTTANVAASNGIIHVIDQVLIPARNCP